MWPFGKSKKKKRQEALLEQKRLEEAKKLEAAKKQEELEKQAKIEEQRKQEEIAKQAKQQAKEAKEAKEQAKETKKEEPKPKAKAKTQVSKKKNDTEKKSPSGKYEIFPEAGLYKFRLKASNGEILAVSFGYSTKAGAKNGINTFKKNCESGQFEISTDKAGFTHFDLFGARGARVIIIGEFYKTVKLAESAVESVKKFYKTERILELDEIPKAEIREEIVKPQKVDPNHNGKYVIEKEGPKAFFAKLVANNGQVLLVSQKYTTKQATLNGLDSIKKAIESQHFTVSKDKQNRYQYNLYTANKQLIVSGESYADKKAALSSIQSVLRFALNAKTEA